MDEVDGNSRDTSTEGSSGSFPHSRPEPLLSNYEPLPQHHLSWSPSQPPGDMTHGQELRGPNISCPGERTDVDRTNLNYGPPTVVSGSLNQFGSQLAQKQRTVSHPTSVKHDGQRNHDRNSLTNFPAGIGGEETKLQETSLRLHRLSPTDLSTGFLLREDEHLHSGMCQPPLDSRNGLALELRTNFPGGGGVDTKVQETSFPLHRQSPRDLQTGFLLREDEHLHSGVVRPPPDSRNGLTFELRSDLNSQNDKDRDLNNFLSKLENEVSLSLRQVSHPPQQVDLREHLPKPDPSALRENSDWNARMHGASAFERSLMTRSVVQQCSDVNDFESYRQVYGDPMEGLGNSLPIEMRQGYIGAGHLERIVREQDELLRSRDQELLQLKEANHRQSLFIEKVLNEKRLLETAVVEQARHLMSQGAQRSSAEPVRTGVLGSARAFDSQLYETQLAIYKEDFENERKDKLLIKGSADSLKEQLHTALNELRMAQDKLKKAEDELERIKNPYRAAYEPYLRTSSSHSNNTASSPWSSQSAAAAAHSKTPLYRKPADLEPDRANKTILATLTQMDHLSQMDYLSQMATGHKAKVDQSSSTTPNQPSRTELSNPSHLWQKSQSGIAKRLPGQEYQVNQSEMKDSDLVNQTIKAICLTRQGPSNCISHPEFQIHLSKVLQKYLVV